jgi:hypothetical protein
MKTILFIFVISLLLIAEKLDAQSSIGLNYNLIGLQAISYGLSQIYKKNKISVINNCCVVKLRDKYIARNYEYFFDGFSIQSIFSYEINNIKYISPFVSYLVYGTMNLDKRLCLSAGIQAKIDDKLNCSVGIMKPIQPHYNYKWHYYDPAILFSISLYLYKFKATKIDLIANKLE